MTSVAFWEKIICSVSHNCAAAKWQEVRGRPSRDPRHIGSQRQQSDAAHKQPQASTTRQAYVSSRPQSPAKWPPHSHTLAERREQSSANGARPFINQPGDRQQRVVNGHAQDNSQAHWGQRAVGGQSQGCSVPYRGQHPPCNGQPQELPALTSGCYNVTDLKHFTKASRRDISTRGSSVYYLDLDSTTTGFQETQQLWIQALQKTVHELGGKCSDIRRNQEQHMTVRSFSLTTAAGSFDQLAKAVRANPATMRCAGIRIQQSVDQALEAGTKQELIAHGYFHKPLARYPVPLYSSCEAASHQTVLADKQRRLQRRDAAVLESAINAILNQLSLST
ncbi:TPA: hypothetical protein ACH3X2_006904 [Trebouxia sp. C0005]